jgi:hypothetical protein
MISSIRSVSAGIKIMICLATNPAYHQDGFGASYGNSSVWRHKRNMYRWNKAINEYYSNRTAEKIYMVSPQTNVDTENNMMTETVSVNSRNTTQVVKQSNGVHLDVTGYAQLADAFYYFLKNN